MSEKHFFTLFNRFWQEIGSPEFYWQLTTLALVFAATWWLSYFLRHRKIDPAKLERNVWISLGAGSLKRIFFPLLATLLVLILRKTFREMGWGRLSLLDLATPMLISWAIVRVLIYVLRYVFPQGGFLKSFERWISFAVWGGMMLELTNLSDAVIDVLEQVSFKFGKQSLDLWTILHSSVTVCAVMLFALWLARALNDRLLGAERMDGNLRVVLSRLFRSALLLLAVLVSLSLIGVDVTALSVFSGALAVGLGLGLQKIANNYVSGFIILLDRSIRIGNLVALDDKTSGTVTQITTRYTVLKTLGGIEFIIPNEYLVSNTVRNMSYSDRRMRVAFSVQVGYDTDVEKALRLLIEIAQRQARVLSTPAPGALVTDLLDNGIALELGFWVGDPEQGTGGVRSQVMIEILKCFRAEGIDIPYPQRVVHFLDKPPPELKEVAS